MAESKYLERISQLEAQLKEKDNEIEGLQSTVKQISEHAKLSGDFVFKIQEKKASIQRKLFRSTSVLLKSFVPELVGHTRRQIEDYCRDLVINNDHISKMERKMRESIEMGLKKDTHSASSVKCFPTYVRELPTGNECGKFLALDLGGTNFRVVLMEIGKDKKFEMDSKIFSVSSELMKGPGEDLFNYIADCLAEFTKEKGINHEILPLGFTFSFPCKQMGLDSGELINWTKGFTCSGVEGEDVVKLLKKAIDGRNDVKIEVAAILNDTTGCLLSCAWKNPKCRIGMIIGTGTNACYLEEMDKVELIEGDNEKSGSKDMIINTEWGAFGNQGELDFILTKWDKRVDAASVNPGKQIFEKMISGMYMGEVARQVLVDLVEENLIFVGKDTSLLMQHGRFYTKYVSEIESDPVGVFKLCRDALADIGIEKVSDEDCSAVRYVCECISRRAGFMVSAGVTALLKKMDYKDVVVAIDGSVFRFHPHFPNIMKSRISQLMGIDYKFDLMLSLDGSGRGAALVAAVLQGECAV